MELVTYQVKDQVAYIYLNRPEKFNSFNRAMAFELQQHLDACASDKNVRAVYLSGNGKAFCAGQDISELTGENPATFDKILSEHFNPVITKIYNLPLPVVCAVNGVAAGAGANIALCCDIVVATASSSFIQAFSKIGLIPDSGGTFFLPRLIGLQKATALMMLGDKVHATEAENMGMIYKTFSDETFESESKKIAITLASMPTQGLAYTKQALQASANHSLEEQLQLEDTLQYKAGHTDDYKEGIKAFIEKRKPEFHGK